MAVSRPDVNDLVAWIKPQTSPSNETIAVYSECMDAALDFIESRVTLPAGTTNGNYPQRLRTAVLMTGARLAKRSTSPEGVAGFGDLGVVRIMQADPDVERLIMKFRTLTGFY